MLIPRKLVQPAYIQVVFILYVVIYNHVVKVQSCGKVSQSGHVYPGSNVLLYSIEVMSTPVKMRGWG